jgi:hypothetical protein
MGVLYLISPAGFFAVTDFATNFVLSVTGITNVFSTAVAPLFATVASVLSNIDFEIIISSPAFYYTLFAVFYLAMLIFAAIFDWFGRIFKYICIILPFFTFTTILSNYNNALALGKTTWAASAGVFLLTFAVFAVSYSGALIKLFGNENAEGAIVLSLLISAALGFLFAGLNFLFMGFGWSSGIYLVAILDTIPALSIAIFSSFD